MANKDLKTAYIMPLNGGQAGQQIEVLFNPGEYTIDKSNTFQGAQIPGLSLPVTQFVSGNADILSMDLFFDTYSKSSRRGSVIQNEDVRKYTRQIASLMEIDGHLHAPPICEFIWGPPMSERKGLQFTGIIEKIVQKFTYFLDDGTPVRATLNVTFKEYKTVKQQLEEIPRQSPDRTKRLIHQQGDSLWHYASNEYNDPAHWRVIADHNDIENPRLVNPGTELELPPLAK